MKKLMLTLLAIAGLAGAQVQGAARAAAFGAKAWNFFNVAAMPVAVAGAGYALSNFNEQVGNINKVFSDVLANPKIMKFLGTEMTQAVWDAKPWYSKAWYGVSWFDDVTDSLFGKIQKYMGLYGMIAALKASEQQQPQVAAQPTQEEINAYIAQQQAAQNLQPQIPQQFPHGRYGRKLAAGRRA